LPPFSVDPFDCAQDKPYPGGQASARLPNK
jgi:hypothetical protein